MKIGQAFVILFASGVAACSSGESPLMIDNDAAPPAVPAGRGDAGPSGGESDSGGPPVSDAGAGADASAPSSTLALLPANVDWSDVTVGAVGNVVDVGVTNMGTAVSTTLSASLGEAEAQSWEIVSDGCSGKTVAPLANCVIQLRFRPLTNGPLAARLFVRAGTKLLTSSLKGKGIGQARFALAPAPYQFDATAVGKPGSHVFTVTNTGDLPSGIPSFAVGGDTASFQVLPDQTFTCTHGLAAGESCDVKVIFTPPTAGAKAGALEVKGDPGGGALVAIRGTAMLPANLEPAVGSFIFPPTQSGVPGVAKELTFTNTGEAATDALTHFLDGADASQYGIIADSCTGASVASGATCSVTLQPTPTSIGFKHAQLTVGFRTIDLGFAATAAPALVLSPSTWHFGSIEGGTQSTAQTFALTNPGVAATGALAVALAGTDAGQFQIVQNGCTTLGAGETCNVKVRLVPTGTGPRTALLQVSGAGGAQASLTGSAVTPSSLHFDMTSASFDTTKATKTSAPVTLTLTNTGGVASGVIATAINGASFSIAADGCVNKTLAPGASCTVSVVFAPSSGGEKRATFDVSDGTRTASVALGGTCDGKWLLAVTSTGAGAGTIGGDGIDCPSDCAEAITHGDTATLTPSASEGSIFSGWTGCDQVQGTQCSVSLLQDRTVSAKFTKKVFNVTVTKAGTAGATGAVSSSLPGIDCGATCVGAFSYGTNVVLTATPDAGGTFERWSGACTGTEPTCSVSVTEARGVTAYFTRPNYVFVTSTKHVAGSLGGQSGADTICQARATAAGLGGTYKAWLATSTTSAVAHLTGAFAPRGFVRMDGKPFADSLADLTNGEVLYPVALNEFGQPVGSARVITGAQDSGQVASPSMTCDDWTNPAAVPTFMAGVATGGTNAWTRSYFVSGDGRYPPHCSEEGRLYCFGTDYRGALPKPSVAGRRAFVTEGFLQATAGLAGADALCSSEAAAAGLAGTFKALLATSTASAVSRMSMTGAPWFRVDGVQLVQSPTALGSETLMSALNVTPTGKYRGRYSVSGLGDPYIWAGAISPNAQGDKDTTCTDWSEHYDAAVDAPFGRIGLAVMADEAFFGIDPMYMQGCGRAPIYCFEQ